MRRQLWCLSVWPEQAIDTCRAHQSQGPRQHRGSDIQTEARAIGQTDLAVDQWR